MNDSEIMAKLLLELRMDAETLGKSIGKQDGDTIRNVLHKRNRLSPKLARMISDKHKVNYKWLMTGDGEVFAAKEKNPLPPPKENNSCLVCEEKERVIKLLENQIAEQTDRIAEQKEVIKYHDKCIEELTRSEAREPGRKNTG